MPIGSNFDDFLKQESIYQTVTASAMEKVLVMNIQSMKIQQLPQTAIFESIPLPRVDCVGQN